MGRRRWPGASLFGADASEVALSAPFVRLMFFEDVNVGVELWCGRLEISAGYNEFK